MQGELFNSFEEVGDTIGKRIADGIMSRIQSFPKREALLGRQAGRMDSLPEDILWEGLGEESAPIFVVYKLIHEAFSNAPQFFRSALVEFLRAQPERFSAVFNRETIWSVIASLPGLEAPGACPSVQHLANFLTQAQQRGIWWRSGQEILREAQAIHHTLTKVGDTFAQGFAALRALQSEKARGIACGNLLLNVPGRLAAYASEVESLGRLEKLPGLPEMHGRIDEFARDSETDARHESIPLDLLYTTMQDDLLHVRILVRAKANATARADIRRRSLYLRYFLRKAFAGYRADQLDVKLAFYLDQERAHSSWNAGDSLFHPQEWTTRNHFWNELCPGADPEKLFGRIRSSATRELMSQGVVGKLMQHFSRMNANYFETQFATTCPDGGWPAEFAIITACATTGEQWTEKRNQDADERLANQLHARKAWVHRVTGYSPSTLHSEPGWAVRVGWQEACTIGVAFRQDAIYFVSGDDLWVSYCDQRRALVHVGTFRSRITSGPPPWKA